VHHHVLGVCPSPDDAEDAVPLAPSLDALAQGGDLAGELEAGDVSRRAGWGGIVPLALEEVGAVESGGPDTYQHLTGAWTGARDVTDFQHLDAPGARDDGGAHGGCVR
jgi:hypothetical protein